MLTSPYSDLVTDPYLLTPRLRTREVFSRNIRLIYILTLSAGTLVGAALYYYADTVAVVWGAFALRTGNLVHVLVAGAVKDGDEEGKGQGEAEKMGAILDGEGATRERLAAKEEG